MEKSPVRRFSAKPSKLQMQKICHNSFWIRLRLRGNVFSIQDPSGYPEISIDTEPYKRRSFGSDLWTRAHRHTGFPWKPGAKPRYAGSLRERRRKFYEGIVLYEEVNLYASYGIGCLLAPFRRFLGLLPPEDRYRQAGWNSDLRSGSILLSAKVKGQGSRKVPFRIRWTFLWFPLKNSPGSSIPRSNPHGSCVPSPTTGIRVPKRSFISPFRPILSGCWNNCQ